MNGLELSNYVKRKGNISHYWDGELNQTTTGSDTKAWAVWLQKAKPFMIGGGVVLTGLILWKIFK